MKHTPGSWVAGKEVPSDPHETEHVVKAGPFYIASVHRMIGMSEHDDQTIPNARLIAAAPDLLEACKEASAELLIAANDARDAAKTDNRWCGVAEHLTRRRARVEAAISKAEGRTQ